jgi:uncharacterized membrane protein YhaH (DUF805 family)
MRWYVKVLKDYAEFNGRARRREYWSFYLVNLLIALVLAIVDLGTGFFYEPTGQGLFSTLYFLGVVMPATAVSVRRLHDTGRTGWWLLLFIIPLLGALAIVVFMLLNSDPGDNVYGPNPKELSAPVGAHGI